jgi:ATP-dependent DNA helicase RecQ
MPEDARLDIDGHLSQFGLSGFRPGQREVIAAVLAGRDCLCVMPTGGGKSLCYQLPAVALRGLTLVVSPLIALMKDQVDQLLARNLPATFVNSTLSLAEQHGRLEDMAAGRYRLVYVVPERFRSPRFLEAVRAADLKLLAVDEAHCISEWGHDFRPDYARLGKFRRLLGSPPTIALTATATDAVRRDIIEQLHLVDPQTVITGFARPNLIHEVRTPRNDGEKMEALLEFLRKTPGSGIIYTSSRKRTEQVARSIAEQLRRGTVVYHAGMQSDERHAAQDAFMGGRAEIVVATNAFGMGIDKPDVRFVVHYNMPGTVEAYYQEAGRAGRDGKPSQCLLLYTASDRRIQEYFIESAYPAPESVARVYEYLRGLGEEPIELTQQEIKQRLQLAIGLEGVGECEQLLESAGVLERLVANQNMAGVRLDSDLPNLVDLLPKQATVRRRVLAAVQRLVGPRRHEMVPFRPGDLAEAAGLDQNSLTHALRELNAMDAFTYVPPFRGRAIRMLRRDQEFDELEIDFEALQKRKEAEYEKLQRVIRFALSPRCRQKDILLYFGQAHAEDCGHCDNCTRTAARPRQRPAALGPNENVTRAVRIVLSGVARAAARFPCGRNLIADMLCGSGSQRVEKLGLSRLSTFGLLKELKQTEIATLIDGLVAMGLLEQVDLEANRPVLRVTPAGLEVMKGTKDLREDLSIPADLLTTLRGDRPAATSPRAAKAALQKTIGTSSQASEPATAPDAGLLAALRQWRSRQAAEERLPAYMVLSNAVLEALARQRPASLGAVSRIKGIGEAKLEKYGEAVLAVLGRRSSGPRTDEPEKPSHWGVCEHTEVASPPVDEQATDESPELTSLPKGGTYPAHYWTWRLLAAGFRAEECCQIRRISRETALDHALQALEEGLPVGVDRCLSAELIAALDQLVVGEAPQQVRPLLAQLPQNTSYQEVQLYLRCRQQGT